MKLLKQSIFCMVCIVLSMCFANVVAAEYYADVSISVDEKGITTIEGTSNHEKLEDQYTTQDFTSMKGKYWLLNVTLDEPFSTFLYKINLPEHAVINYIKTPQVARIEDGTDGLSITGTGENQAFRLIVQYSINTPPTQNSSLLFLVPTLGILAIAGLVGYGFWSKKKVETSRPYNPDTLTPRQLEIVTIIESSDKPVTQAHIEKQTKLPKSSLSRNINSLVAKHILIKESKGMTNVLSLKRK